MKKLLAIIALLTVTVCAHASDITVGWTLGDNPTATTNWFTLVWWGPTTGGPYTNSFAVPYTQTVATITNLVSGQRYCIVVQHSDGTDVSAFSNEATTKTKINPPKNNAVIP